MLGKNFEIPRLESRIVEFISIQMEKANQEHPAKSGEEKKAWVKAQAKDIMKTVDLKKIPAFIEEPIKDAVVSVVIDVLWTAVFKKKLA